jgi:hypothetical protein
LITSMRWFPTGSLTMLSVPVSTNPQTGAVGRRPGMLVAEELDRRRVPPAVVGAVADRVRRVRLVLRALAIRPVLDPAWAV